MRESLPRVCMVCGKTFMHWNGRAKLCPSGDCKSIRIVQRGKARDHKDSHRRNYKPKPSPQPRACCICGKSFVPYKRSPNSTCCSKDCRRKRDWQKEKAKGGKVRAPGWAKEWRARRKAEGRPVGVQARSERCHKPTITDAVLAGILCTCGKRGPEPGKGRCRPCLDKASSSFKKQRNQRKAAGLCQRCGGGATHGKTTFCRECLTEVNAALARASAEARMKGVRQGVIAKGDKIVSRKVFERDGWRCQICGGKVKRGAGKKHPLSPQTDHRVPLSKGGTHTYDNVQCAHRKCNAAKSNRNSVGQIPLWSTPDSLAA